MLAGVEEVTSGAIRFGSNVNRAYYAQHQLETLISDDTVYETIQKSSQGWGETDIRSYLGSFMFTGDEINKYIKVLSGGEKARVALAKMLIEPSHLLLLDEPTNHLDILTRNVVEDALKKFTGAIICISHDRHFLNQVTNLICEVGNGTIQLFEGNYDYYEWKKQDEVSSKSISPAEKKHSKGKPNYKKQKQLRNRLVWIDKRLESIENQLELQKKITQNPSNGDNYELLQKAMEEMNNLESDYLQLLEEKEANILKSKNF